MGMVQIRATAFEAWPDENGIRIPRTPTGLTAFLTLQPHGADGHDHFCVLLNLDSLNGLAAQPS